MSNTEASPTRRLMLGGSIATLGGASALASAGGAAAAAGPHQSSTGTPAAASRPPLPTLPVLGANEQSIYFGPLGWAAYDFATGSTVVISGGSGSRATSGWLGRSVDLVPGSRITGLDFTLRGPGAVSGSCFLQRLTPDTSGSWSTAGTVSGSVVGTFSTNISQLVTPETSYSVEIFTADASYVSGVRVRYEPPAPSGLNLVAITPARVYDSRKDMFPDADGPMSAGTNRTISVANGRDPGTGVVNLADVVPATAKAIAYTLTVTGTTAGGYLAVNPGGDTVVHASTINWAADQTLANSGVIGISAGRTVTVVCGSGTTQFIVDVIGYYVS